KMSNYVENQDFMMNNELIWKAIKTFKNMSNCIKEESELYFKKEYYDIFNKTIAQVVPDFKSK
nr:hypothetical protein [Helicobacteraceae bacterium]